MITVSSDLLKDMASDANSLLRLRKHHNLHQTFAEPVQRVVNVILRNSYICPHCHEATVGTETLVALEGLMALVIFEGDAEISEIILLGTERYSASHRAAVLAEVPCGKWHTIVALGDSVTLLEIKAGPFHPKSPKKIASWAPQENSIESREFLEQLRQQITRTLDL